MNQNEYLAFLLETAEIHAKRLRFAINKISHQLPLTSENFHNLDEQSLPLFELFTSRFAKLQDYLGSKIFNIILEIAGLSIENSTFIDKLNMLEKIKVIPDAYKCRELREIRNHLSHEYPNNPEKAAYYFNQAFMLAPYLLECYENIKLFINKANQQT